MRIHFIGINGVSMRALSELAASDGHTVTGSDSALGVHRARNVDGSDLVVYTNAVPQDNCELVRAKELGIPVIERAEYLGEVARSYGTTVAVAGCHGKSTATAMLGAALGMRSPTVHVGAAGGSRIGGKGFFVTEACEYNRSFLHLSPDIGIALNIGFDHPDCYADIGEVKKAFGAFLGRCGTAIVNGDDGLCAGLCRSPVTFGLSPGCDCRAEYITSNAGMRTFTYVHGKRRVRVKLAVPGAHNVYNATAALAAADLCGAELEDAARGIESFCGIARRFERCGSAFGKDVITDYAHHPDEIAATIAAARELYPTVAAVFQPHTYSRTAALADGFAAALTKADTVILAPVYAARERSGGADSRDIARRLSELGKRAYCFDGTAEILKLCRLLEEKAVLFLGAGDIDSAARAFVKLAAEN